MGFRPGGKIHLDDETKRRWLENGRGEVSLSVFGEYGRPEQKLRETAYQLPNGEIVGTEVLRHEVGPLVDDKQKCLRCAALLCDFRNPMHVWNPGAPTGWPIGFIYQAGWTMYALRREPNKFRDCASRRMLFAMRG